MERDNKEPDYVGAPSDKEGASVFNCAEAGSFFVEDESWLVSAGSVRGPLHEEKSIPCDDAAAAGVKSGWLAAVVCDGAGSAQLSRVGSAIASTKIVERLLDEAPQREPETTLFSLAVSALSRAREEIEEAAQSAELTISSYATTVVGTLCRNGRGIIFHLGDGLGLAKTTSALYATISHGSPKEYANETYFLTDRAWKDYLTCSPVFGAKSVCLMTDGASPFALDGIAPKNEFIDPIEHYLLKRGAEATSEAIVKLLDREDARRLVGDDKTLLWAQCALNTD